MDHAQTDESQAYQAEVSAARLWTLEEWRQEATRTLEAQANLQEYIRASKPCLPETKWWAAIQASNGVMHGLDFDLVAAKRDPGLFDGSYGRTVVEARRELARIRAAVEADLQGR